MKHLLLTLLVPLMLVAGIVPVAEQSHAEKILAYDVKLFGLQNWWVDITIRRGPDMHEHGVWGDVRADENGYHIEVCATEDYPASIPPKNRVAFQNDIIQHEVMHIRLTQLGVPSQVQDELIEGLLPALRKP
jgi:hypothetical protein